MNLFDPLLGAEPASDIVTSVESLPCEKLYPSNTPILKQFASTSLPLNVPVPVLPPSAVVVAAIVSTVTTKPEAPELLVPA